MTSALDIEKITQLLAILSEQTERRAAENRRAAEQQKLQRKNSTEAVLRTQQIRDDYLLVVAFDLGTTFSGYAFSFRNNQGHTIMNKNWGADIGFNSYKTPTCLLLNAKKGFVEFGYKAQNKYAGMTEEESKNHYYFERFKMALYNAKDLGNSTTVAAVDGKKLPATYVFAQSLKHLKDHCLEAITKSVEQFPDKKYIRWVITVPAIWSDASKQFMRQTAFEAGLIDDLSSGQLVIALEPEAASLFCRTLSVDNFATVYQGSKKEAPKLPPGTKYMVIDAGGGTLDVTCHEIQADGTVKELHVATGGALGGSRVNDKFVALLNQLFGASFMQKFQKDCPVAWLDMVSKFEMTKRSIQAGDANAVLNFSLHYALGTKFYEVNGKSIETLFNPCEMKGISFSNGLIRLDRKIADGLFNEVIGNIVKHIEGLMKDPRLANLKYFFMVGGFSDCSLLRAAILQQFGKKVVVLIPSEAVLAVMKGAVLFGHHPSAISKRIAALTYGVRSAAEFDRNIHDERRKSTLNGRDLVQDSFKTFITMGDEIQDGFTKTMAFTPLNAEQDAATVQILTANKKQVTYSDEPGVEKHGVIEVSWPGKGKDRSVEISMTFGGTEIQVSAVAFPGGNSANTTVNFLSK